MSIAQSNKTVSHEVYLDNNATTPVLPQVVETVVHTMQKNFGNPSSSHITGVKAKHILESTRALARKVIGADNGEIIFTSGATEGIQTAVVSSLLSIREKNSACEDSYLLYGATEHKAVPNTLEYWNKVLGVNAKVMAIPVDDKGLLDMSFISDHITNTLMICTMAVNNETGVYQDLAQLDDVIRSKNKDVLWMVDCVQTLGKSALHISNTSIDYAPFSGHKIYTPKGIGMLYVRAGSPNTPFIAGGGQENGMRSGTENIPGVAAMGRVFSLLLDDNDDTFKPKQQLEGYRTQIADTLIGIFPGIVFNNDFAHSVPTTINFSVKGMSSKEIMDLLDAASIRVSSGSACSSKVTRSFVLDAMGAQSWQSESAIRMSFGPAATQAEIDYACEAIKQITPALHHSCLILSDAFEIDDSQFKSGFVQLKYNDCCCWLYVDMDARECIVIDPLPQLADRITKWVNCHNLSVKVVMDTHVHLDRPSYHNTFKDILTAHVPEVLKTTDANGWPMTVDGDIQLSDKFNLPWVGVGQMKVSIVQTPGHCENGLSVVFIDANDKIAFALVGDIIMPGGFGRTDVQGADCLAFYESLKTLNHLLTPNTVLGTSHDYQHRFATTLQIECAENTLLAKVLSDEICATDFATQKQAMDAKLVKSEPDYLCGLVEVADGDEPFSLAADDILGFLAENPTATVLDIRETYECEAGDLQPQLKLGSAALNVPLTRLSDFAISGDYCDKGPLLLVCRTGNRSMLACKSLLRLGYRQVYNIKGGLALFNG